MYSVLLNEKIKQKYKKYNRITKNFSDFFDHISFMSPSLFTNLKTKKEVNEKDMLKWFEKLETINTISEICLSFVIICKNEERNIKKCLSSIISEIKELDEVLVIDTGSNDKTKEIISSSFEQVRLVEAIWNDDFSEIRNLAITMVNNEWIFFIDADEIILEGSIKALKKNLKIIEWYNFREIVISPTIVNSNDHIVNSVKRIFRKNGNIRYFGVVHEELRKIEGNVEVDLLHIAFDNVIITHDGYKVENIKSKDKVKRNYSLLLKMIKIEPFNPRWKYFLCRDCREILEEEIYEKYLLESIQMCKEEYNFRRYKIGAITELIQLYLEKNEREKFNFYLQELETIAPDISSIIYYKSLQKYNDCYKKICQLRNELIIYRNSKNKIEYGGIHSNYYHIDFVIGQLLFLTGKYKEAFHILENLEKREYGEYKVQFKMLHEELARYMK